mgnify:CR=1 FL=1
MSFCVMIHSVHSLQLLLLLTEQEDDLIVLKAVEGLETAIGAASDKPFSPVILHNLLKISSRFKTIGMKKEVQGYEFILS